MTTQIYNDLGFTMQDRTLVLMEAQSTWSLNIAVRSLIYLGKTFQEYVHRTRQSYYNEKAVRLPKPELYVLYSGDRKHAEELSRADGDVPVPDGKSGLSTWPPCCLRNLFASIV